MWSFDAVTLFAVALFLSFSASADTDCTNDFFSDKTCRSFDDTTLWQGAPQLGSGEDVDGAVFRLRGMGFVGDERWYRDSYYDDQALGRALNNRDVGNQAIHSFRCAMDLFGNISCDWISQLPD